MYDAPAKSGNGHDLKAAYRNASLQESMMQGGASPRTPAVSEQLGITSKRTEQLHNIISSLEQRLDLIVRPSPPQDETGGNTAPIPSVQLAAGLMDLNARIESACARLDSLLNRIDL